MSKKISKLTKRYFIFKQRDLYFKVGMHRIFAFSDSIRIRIPAEQDSAGTGFTGFKQRGFCLIASKLKNSLAKIILSPNRIKNNHIIIFPNIS